MRNPKIKFLLVQIVTMAIALNLKAQVNDTRAIIPPSPNVTSLLKFNEVPVSKYTGIPETNIPLYEIQSGAINIPINLQYHSAGVRVSETASWAGMGWALNYGGIVTQSIRGMRDDWQNGRFNSTGFDRANPTLCDLNNMLKLLQDGEPDLYSFSCGGLSGSFYLDDNKKIIQIPEQKLRIEPIALLNSIVPYQILSWKITDLIGNQFFFETEESVYTQSILSNGSNILMSDEISYPDQTQRSWHLSKIVDPNGNTVTFSYDTYNSLDYIYSSENKRYIYDAANHTPVGQERLITYMMQNVSTGKRIRMIQFKGGRVEFTAGGNRCDLSGDKYLDKVSIFNDQNIKLKEFDFDYKYYVGSNIFNLSEIDCSGDAPFIELEGQSSHNYFKDRRLFLTAVDLWDGNNTKMGSYTFEYENSIGLPNRFSAQQDWWGLYNGNGLSSLLGNLHKTPSGTYDILGRNTNIQYAKQGILTKITYPTGGYVQYEYEPNSLPYSFGPTYTVHPQVVYNASGLNRNQYLGAISFNDVSGSRAISFQVERCIFGPTGTPAAGFYLKDNSGNVVLSGEQVTNYNQETNNGKFTITLQNGVYTMYSYAIADIPCNYAITLYEFTETAAATTSDYAWGGLRIKSINSVDPISNSITKSTYDYSKTINGQTMSSGTSSVQLDRATYNYSYYASTGTSNCGNTSGLPCKESANSIVNVVSNTNLPIGTNHDGYISYSQVTERRENEQGEDLGYTYYEFQNEPQDFTLAFSNQVGNPVAQGVILGISSRSLAPAYSYVWARGNPLKIYQYAKVGANTYQAVKKQDYYYSQVYLSEYVSAVSASYLLKSAYPYENSSCPGRSIADAYSYTLYNLWTGYRLLDSSIVQDIDKTGGIAKITTYYRYDSTTLLPSMIKTVDSKNSMIVQHMRYPLNYAIPGTATNDISRGIQNLQNIHMIAPVIEHYTQRSDKDGSNLRTIAAVLNTYKPTAPLINEVHVLEPNYPLTDFVPATISTSSYDKDSRYALRIHFKKYDQWGNLLEVQKSNDRVESYLWGYNSRYPVAKVIGGNYDQANIHINQTILDNSNSTYSDEQLRTELNKIRTNLPTALVSTYTYQPSVGITSETDPSGKTIFYEYDGFGRLKLIKNQYGKLLKQFSYQYQQPITQ